MNHVLDARALRLVQAVREAGTVTAAAARLHLTQPAVSQALADLERRLGVALFARDRRRLRPTAAGRRLADAAGELLAELARLEAEVRGRGTRAAGPLRITTECYTCYHWLPAALAELQRSFPDVRLELVPEATREPYAALRGGRVDVAIVATPSRDRRFDLQPLFHDELVAAVAPSHRLAARRYLNPRDLAAEHLLLHVEPKRSTVVGDFLKPAGVRPARVSALQLTEAVLETARAGFGVAVVARWAAAPMLRAGSLRAVPLGRRGLVRQWWAARPAGRAGGGSAATDAGSELIDLLRRSVLGMGAS
jgi:LysR family transcriptional regulator for metE and metH